MSKQTLAKCPNCGKILNVPEDTVSVYCIKCKTHSNLKQEDSESSPESSENQT